MNTLNRVAFLCVLFLTPEHVTAEQLAPPVVKRFVHGDKYLVGGGPTHNLTERDQLKVSVARGAKTNLFVYFDTDAECRKLEIGVKTVRAPTHGHLVVAPASVPHAMKVLSWPQTDPRRACDTGNMAAVRVDYTPDSSFDGQDFVVEEINDGAYTRVEDIYITD